MLATGFVLHTLYEKVFQLGPRHAPAGEDLTLLGTDTGLLLNIAWSFHEAWNLTLQLATALCLMHH